MEQEPLAKDLFLENLKTLFGSIYHEEDPLKTLRSKAWDHFLELGAPERRDEAFRYIPLRKLYAQKWERKEEKTPSKEEILAEVLPECQHSYLAIVDGVLRLDLSDVSALPKSLFIQSLEASLPVYGAFLQNRFSKMLKEERNPFVVLNAAMQKGFFILVPPETSVEAPLQCLEFVTGSTQLRAFFPRFHLALGARSTLSVIATASVQTREMSPYFTTSAVDLTLEEGAKLTWITSKSPLYDAIVLDHIAAFLKKNSEVHFTSLGMGLSLYRESYHIHLAGEEAEASIKSLGMLEGNAQLHTHIVMEHSAPHTTSTQHIKSVQSDKAKSSFEGKIFVHRNAEKTEAYQLNNTLLLGEYAQSYSKPNLEILADDVKASHGATVTELNTDELFYLKTRGIPEAMAKNLLIRGFCLEIIEGIECDSLNFEALQKIEQLAKETHVSSLPVS